MSDSMIRDRLINLPDDWVGFYGVVSRFGVKEDKSKKTVCIENVKLDEDDANLASHVWFDCKDIFKDIRIDDLIYFESKVIQYKKGPLRNIDDLTLSAPRSIKLLYRFEKKEE